MSRRRVLRWAIVTIAGVLVLGVVAFFVFAPGIVERSRNVVEPGPLPQVGEETQELHDSLLVADLHADTLLWDRDLLERSDRGQVDLPRLQEGNVGLQVFASVTKSPKGQNYDANSGDSDNITLLTIAQLQPPSTWFSLLRRALHHADRLTDAADGSGGALRVVRTSQDLAAVEAARGDGEEVTGGLLALEGLHPLEGDLGNLATLYDAGFRMAGLTHFFDNEVAGSMHGLEKGGLTDLGREVLAEMERLGMVVDVAHASHAAVAEVLATATRPVVSSHGGVQATCAVNRNLTDEEVRGVAATGGVVGIGYWNGAVCDTSVAAVVDAIAHVRDLVGIRHVGLGSDFDGSVTTRWDTSQVAVVTQELVDRGFSEQEIRAVMGGNVLRVLRRVLPSDETGR